MEMAMEKQIAVVLSSLISLLRGVRRALEEADDVAVVISNLKQAAALLLPPEYTGGYGCRQFDEGDPSVKTVDVGEQSGEHPDACAVNQLIRRCVSAAKSALPHGAEKDHLGLIRHVFYRENCFFTFSKLLLYEVAPDWLACFTNAQQWSFFDAFFLFAPALVVLQALAPEISVPRRFAQKYSEGEEEETSAAQRAAERLIVLRLLGPRKEKESRQVSGGAKDGIQEIALQFGELRNSVAKEESAPSNRDHDSRRWNTEFVREVAVLIVSLPDRTTNHAAHQLTTPSFFRSIIRQLIAAGNECRKSSTGRVNCTQRNLQAGMEKEAACAEREQLEKAEGAENTFTCRHNGHSDGEGTYLFIAEMITRMCRRGHADLLGVEMAQTLMDDMAKLNGDPSVPICDAQHKKADDPEKGRKGKSRGKSWWSLVAAKMVDLHACERWLESLLRHMAKLKVSDRDAVACLETVLEKSVYMNPIISSLFTERFLLQRSLPLSCLRWILSVGVMSSTPLRSAIDRQISGEERGNSDVEEESDSKAELRRQTIGRLGEVWGNSQFVRTAEIKLQGYVSSALAICLSHINRRMIEEIPDLMPSILQGVSARLDSPLMPIRRMGMRVAEVFSRSFDPGNVLIFEEEGGGGGGNVLLWEEGWWDAAQMDSEVGVAQRSQEVVGQERQLSQQEGVEEGESGSELVSRIKKEEELQLRRRRDLGKARAGEFEGLMNKRLRRRERRERLTVEEDDPDAVIDLAKGKHRGLGSDHEDETSASDSDSVGSEYSEDSLEPFDLSDDEEDLERAKVPGQLRLCLGAFRKTDDPDGVTRALNVVESLVRAMPDELDDYSPQLTSALIRVSPSDISVAAEEGSAAEKRHRALVALLTCSTLPSLSVVMKEVYSPHMDSSHRLVILDAMEDAAVELSSLETSFSEQQRPRVMEGSRSEAISDTPWWGPPHPGDRPEPRGTGPWVEARVSEGVLSLPRYERELPLLPGTREVGKSRRWGHRALQLRMEGASVRTPGSGIKMNRFAPYAATFMLPLMRDYDKVDGSLDLVSRDFFVFGRVLQVLGVFVTCSSPSVETLPLATGLLELLRTREVSQHREAYVRQCALDAAACVLLALSPTNVTSALGDLGGMLAVLLAWVYEWAKAVASIDSDEKCVLLAERCLMLHAGLMADALGTLERASIQQSMQISVNPAKLQTILIQPL